MTDASKRLSARPSEYSLIADVRMRGYVRVRVPSRICPVQVRGAWRWDLDESR